MRTSSLFLRALPACSFVFAACLYGAAPAPVTLSDRLAAQNALFEEEFQAQMRESPETATAYGDYRYNDQLDDESLAGVMRRHTATVGYLARLKAIPEDGFPEQDRISHDLMVRTLEQRLADFDLKEYEMPLNMNSSLHTGLADLPLSMPFDSVKHYEDYLARLHQIPRAFLQHEEVLRAGVKDGLVPVRFIAEKFPKQCEGIIEANPFLLPTKKYPASIPQAEQDRLTAAITSAVNTDVLPAYKQFAGFLASDYAPHGRTALAITSLPDGPRRYQNDIHRMTTTELTAAQIHEIGLREYDRIIGEMTALAKANGYPDLASFRTAMEKDPKYIPASPEAMLDDFRGYIAQMQPKLTELFTLLPKSPVTVEAIPAFQTAASTHYQTGTPDGKRPGRVVVAVSDIGHRSMLNDEATAYHEGIPGHHMQLSVAQQLTGLPKFRLHSFNSGYIEGWALYAEQLGKEIGFYRAPGSDYGRLRSELFRAVRLVVDTGIHTQGWTRDQVVDYFRKSGSAEEPLIQTETDRYISWPAQALAYKLGQLKIRELRTRAQQQLGAQFDIRTFHDEILDGGVLPLDMLDARVDAWIKAHRTVRAAQVQ